ncbi:MAG: biotin/lipoyl-binding protein [Clostridia bacterium]|nr:biotin/lipoyl-binding protein [Clostridia bacterium]
MKKREKIILWTGIGLFILAAVLYGTSRPIKTDLYEVKRQTMEKSFTEEGTVVAERESPVTPPYTGKVVELYVKEGQRVKKGDPLAKLDSTQLKHQVEQLKAQLKALAGEKKMDLQQPYQSEIRQQELAVEQAQINFDNAQRNFKRISQLYEAGIVSAAEYEEAQDTLKSAENALFQQREALALLYESHKPTEGKLEYYAGREEVIRKQMEETEEKISDSLITSPAEGIVTELEVKEGEYVSQETPLLTVINEDVHIEAYVLAEDVFRLKENMSVKIKAERDRENISFEGKITHIAPTAETRVSTLGVEEQRVKVRIKPQQIPSSIKLRPGYVLDVQFITDTVKDQLMVPKTAVFSYKYGEALWVVRKGRAQIQKIKKGMENDRYVVVLEGIKEGEIIILNPQTEGLKEGKRIAIKRG